MAALRQQQQAQTVSALLAAAAAIGTAFPIIVKNVGAMEKENFTSLCDALSDTIKMRNLSDTVAVVGALIENKPAIFACGGQAAQKKFGIHAGEIVKAAAALIQGNGGGGPQRAQAGGKNPAALDAALAAALETLLKKAGKP
jgi:alanyl-tRNA synthetase